MTRQDTADDRPLNADTPAVDEAHDSESVIRCRRQIFLDHRGDVTRRKGVEVERILEGNREGSVVAQKRGPAITCCCQ
jgi:hypothetical protein